MGQAVRVEKQDEELAYPEEVRVASVGSSDDSSVGGHDLCRNDSIHEKAGHPREQTEATK